MDEYGLPEKRRWFSRRAARSLEEACRAAGCDENGERCSGCPVEALCEDESRWLIQFRNQPPLRLN